MNPTNNTAYLQQLMRPLLGNAASAPQQPSTSQGAPGSTNNNMRSQAGGVNVILAQNINFGTINNVANCSLSQSTYIRNTQNNTQNIIINNYSNEDSMDTSESMDFEPITTTSLDIDEMEKNILTLFKGMNTNSNGKPVIYFNTSELYDEKTLARPLPDIIIDFDGNWDGYDNGYNNHDSELGPEAVAAKAIAGVFQINDNPTDPTFPQGILKSAIAHCKDTNQPMTLDLIKGIHQKGTQNQPHASHLSFNLQDPLPTSGRPHTIHLNLEGILKPGYTTGQLVPASPNNGQTELQLQDVFSYQPIDSTGTKWRYYPGTANRQREIHTQPLPSQSNPSPINHYLNQGSARVKSYDAAEGS